MKKMSRIEVVVIPIMILIAIIALPMYVLTVISPYPTVT
jgi:hypothetical protein